MTKQQMTLGVAFTATFLFGFGVGYATYHIREKRKRDKKKAEESAAMEEYMSKTSGEGYRRPENVIKEDIKEETPMARRVKHIEETPIPELAVAPVDNTNWYNFMGIDMDADKMQEVNLAACIRTENLYSGKPMGDALLVDMSRSSEKFPFIMAMFRDGGPDNGLLTIHMTYERSTDKLHNCIPDGCELTVENCAPTIMAMETFAVAQYDPMKDDFVYLEGSPHEVLKTLENDDWMYFVSESLGYVVSVQIVDVMGEDEEYELQQRMLYNV